MHCMCYCSLVWGSPFAACSFVQQTHLLSLAKSTAERIERTIQ